MNVLLVAGTAGAAGLAAHAAVSAAGLVLYDVPPLEAADFAATEPTEDEVEERATGPPTQLGPIASQIEAIRESILLRNIFCPTCLLPILPLGEDEPVAPPELGGGKVVRSQLPLKLVGTMEAEPPNLSYATVYEADKGVIGLFAEGEIIRDNVAVERVVAGILYIRHGSQREYVPFGEAQRPPKSAPAAKPSPEKKEPKRHHIPGATESIECSNESHCVVDKAFAESLLADPAKLVGQARFVAKKAPDGRPGYALYGVRKGSLPQLLGVKNGDIVVSVNGADLGSMDQTIKLYGKLRHATRLEVEYVRKGKPGTREIELR